MKWILPIAFLTLISCTLVVSYLFLLNEKAGAEIKQETVTSFNRSDIERQKLIFHEWQMSRLRLDAVENYIEVDLLFIALYTAGIVLILRGCLRAFTGRPFIKMIGFTGICSVIGAAVINIVTDLKLLSVTKAANQALNQDETSSAYVFSPANAPFTNSHTVIIVKLVLVSIAVVMAIISILSVAFSSRDGQSETSFIEQVRFTVSQFFKCLWVFFPGIFFLLLSIAAFWLADQGKDIIVAFQRNSTRTVNLFGLQWNYSRIIFFLAIAFWAYVSWYSSRIIYYIKRRKQEEPVDEIAKDTGVEVKPAGEFYPNITPDFMVEFPRMTGNACFLVLELSFLQSPMMILALSSTFAWILFAELVAGFYFVNRWVSRLATLKSFDRWFRLLLFGFAILLVIVSFFNSLPFFMILALVIILHVIYILYTNLHREQIKANAKNKYVSPKGIRVITERIMKFFCIPLTETQYYKWFIYTGFAGAVFYLLCIGKLHTARIIGPFPFILLAFSVLLAFLNAVTAFSIKYKINFHFILLLLAFLTGLWETHEVQQIPVTVDKVTVRKRPRPDLKTYLSAWFKHNPPEGQDSVINMYFIMSNGGASRSGFWSAAVLGRVQDASRNSAKLFSDRIFCLSGTSGGGVGVAGFFSVLGEPGIRTDSTVEHSMEDYLRKDYFTFTFARLLSGDFFHYIVPLLTVSDRARKLEESFENSTLPENRHLLSIPFDRPFSSFEALKPDGDVQYPLLFINTTRVQDGNPGIITNLKPDSITFNSRVDVIRLLADTCDITLASASILGARFPYLSPAGRIADNDFVDGGYFDNSGAGVVQELIRAIVNIGNDTSSANRQLAALANKVSFHVVHIVNSPLQEDSASFKPVPPLKNDLLAPVLTILGAYDMQTTVNDGRLQNYISDLHSYYNRKADYMKISLYKSKQEWKEDKDLHRHYVKEPSYAFNWFMSDTTAERMIKRLDGNDSLAYLIRKLH